MSEANSKPSEKIPEGVRADCPQSLMDIKLAEQVLREARFPKQHRCPPKQGDS